MSVHTPTQLVSALNIARVLCILKTMIGPDLPPQLLANRSTTPDDEESEAGPSKPSTVGPTMPPNLLAPKAQPEATEDEDDEDDYMPALPPDFDSARRAQPSASSTSGRKIQGPALPPSLARGRYVDDDEDDEDDDIGPMPLPVGYAVKEKDGVTEFLEKEERRRKQIEVRFVRSFMTHLVRSSQGCMITTTGSRQTESTQT